MTNAQWQAVMKTKGSANKDKKFQGDLQPVVGVSWHEARAFVQRYRNCQDGREDCLLKLNGNMRQGVLIRVKVMSIQVVTISMRWDGIKITLAVIRILWGRKRLMSLVFMT